MDPNATFTDVALALLVAKEVIVFAGKAIEAVKERNSGNGNGNGKRNPGVRHEMPEACRTKMDEMLKNIDQVQTSVVAPDRQPLHVTVRAILGKLSKEAN